MERTDVVVIGAGPSGTSTAYFLAKHGVDVTLIDKSKFPREKTCGDGLGPRSIQMLSKMGLSDWLTSSGYYRCDRARLFSTSGIYFESRIPAEDTPHPHFYITSRKDLDQKLVDVAQSAGAKVYTGCKATGTIISDGILRGVTVQYGDDREIYCKVVVSADGTHGSFTKRAGMDCSKPYAFAVRAYYENVRGLDDCINIYLDNRISEGYAWIFPTSNETANIGLGVSCSSIKQSTVDIRNLFNWFLTERNIYPLDISSAVATSDVKGAYLRMGYGRHEVVADGILLVGDAAGLINPLSGEGIAYALESGEIAADAVKAALDKGDVSSRNLALYKDVLKKHFFVNHRVYELLRRSLIVPPWVERAVRKGRDNPEFATNLISVMMSTTNPTIVFSPKMLAYLLF